MIRFFRMYYWEMLMILLFTLTLYFLFSGFLWFDLIFGDFEEFWSSQTDALQNGSILFLSIFLEALPFLLIGVFLSSLIHHFVKEEMVYRYLPRNPVFSIPLASLLGLILPICECGIVPITKRLIQKGFPAYVAFTFLLAAPVINPITLFSTYIAFGNQWEMVLNRSILVFGISIGMGILFYLCLRQVSVASLLREEKEEHVCHEDGCCDHQEEQKTIAHALYHTIFEFMNTAKYFIMGAWMAAFFQTWFGFSAIQAWSGGEIGSILIMMGLAFLLSVCSSADAFIAASFRSVLGTGPMLAFLVYGPMMDMKNLLILRGHFRPWVIGLFFAGTTVFTLISIVLFF